jgi:hypothetical protein
LKSTFLWNENLMGRQLGKGVTQIPGKGTGTGILETLEEKRNGMGSVNPEIPAEGKGTETLQVWELAHLGTQRGERWELASIRALRRGQWELASIRALRRGQWELASSGL